MNPNFSHKLQVAIQNDVPFVLFRFPDESTIQLNVEDDSGKNRFLLHAFDSTIEKSISDADPIQILQSEFQFDSKLDLKHQEWEDSISKENYEQLIQKTIDEIKGSAIQKIVISRKKMMENKGFDLFQTFKNLLEQHPRALVYFWNRPGEDTWIGATPELLLQQSGNQVQTVSLAGTKRPEKDWTQKEIEEQQFVTDFIAHEFSDLKNLKISGPETVQAGKFQHLKSFISAEISESFDLNLLLKNLHPTPAVCGLPKKEAFDFILKNEGHDRGFYSGYIGIERENSKTYFVNLRSAAFFQNQIQIYVGGGITAESNPEKEWEETELKSGTIANALAQ